MGATEETQLLLLKGHMSDMPEGQRDLINRHADEIIKKAENDDNFLFALSLAGLKLAIKQEEK